MADVTSAVISAVDFLYTLVKDLKPSDIGDYEGDTEMLALSIERTKNKLYNIDEQQLDEAQKGACNKIREAVLDAEDILDRVETLTKMKKKKMLKEAQDWFSSFWNKADEVQLAIKDINNRLVDIEKYLQRFGLQEHSHRGLTRSMSARASGSQVNVMRILGRDEDKRKVIKLLSTPSIDKYRIPVVSIVGMGGMGKTTLAQLVFDDKSWQQGCSFDLRLWVSDSKKLNLESLLKSILKSISPSDSDSFDNLEKTQLKDRLVEEIYGKRFLLVLDDVENEEHWRWTYLEDLLSKGNTEGSRVVVTTHSRTVGDSMGALASTYQLKGLSEEDSLQLFESFAFGDETRDEKLVPIGKRIVEKCAGVPLAIKVIGALLYRQTARQKWVRVMDSELGEDGQIMPILKMSYDDLDSTLKECFSYCALFPKNGFISKGFLSSIWKANVRFKIDEDVCNENLEILYNRCFLEVAGRYSWDTDTHYKMHDLMHDLAKTVAGTEMCVASDAMVDCNKLIIKENVRHLSFLSPKMRNSGALTCELKGRRLRTFIVESPYSEQPLPSDFDKLVTDCSVIRFLDLHGYSIGNLTDSIGELIHLRYLKLSHTNVQTLNSVTELINLQHLSLVWCNALTHLPLGIGELTYLEVLEISSCEKFEELPMDIKNLTNLKQLSLAHCRALTHLPSGVGGLTSLEVLNIFHCEKLEELPMDVEKLRNLKHLSLEGCWALTHLPSGVGGLTSLEVLNISDCVKLEELPMDVEKLTNLKQLSLAHCRALTHLPSGVGGLTSLEVLNIFRCEKLEELPMDVEKLRNLRHLSLEGCWALTHLPSVVGGLTSLEVLYISDCVKLEDLPMDVEKLTNLKQLSLAHCRALTHLPSGVGGLTSLKVLNISDSAKLEELPMDVEKLTNLKQLSLAHCRALTHLPFGVGGLTSLEVLNISRCVKLEELPMDVEKLTNLKELNFEECMGLTKMPSGMGALLPICRPPRFIVGHPKSKHTAQLEELDSVSELIQGELQIELLVNITLKVSERDGKAFLLNKKWLRKLRIIWREKKINMEEDILAKLQPPPTLEELNLDYYPGIEFPAWVPKEDFASALPNLQEICISHCQRCRRLPPLSRLARLKRLELIWLCSLEYIEEDVSSASFCPSLEKLVLNYLPKLKGWCREGLATGSIEQQQSVMLPSFPGLVDMEINGCPNLMVGLILVSFVKVFSVDRQVKTEWSEKREEAMSSSTSPGLSSSAACLFNEICRSSGGFRLFINEEENHKICLEISSLNFLQTLKIGDSSTSTSFEASCSSQVTELPWKGLEELKLTALHKMERLSEGIQFLTSLKKLEIKYCVNLTSLDGDWKGLQSLEELSLYELPEMERLPEGIQFLTSLKKLEITFCDNLTSLDGDWKGLQSLEELSLYQLPKMERLPEGIQFLTSLKKLNIMDCVNLAISEWVHTTFKLEYDICWPTKVYRRVNNS